MRFLRYFRIILGAPLPYSAFWAHLFLSSMIYYPFRLRMTRQSKQYQLQLIHNVNRAIFSVTLLLNVSSCYDMLRYVTLHYVMLCFDVF